MQLRHMDTHGQLWWCFMTRFLLFVTFLNASVTVILDCQGISFYIYSFFFFFCFFCWHFLNESFWTLQLKKSPSLDLRSESCKGKSREKPLPFSLEKQRKSYRQHISTGGQRVSHSFHSSQTWDNTHTSEHRITLWAIRNCSLGNILPMSMKSFVGHWVRLYSQPI